MAKPTLMIRGKLFSNNAEEMAEMNEEIPIEYFIRWYSDRARLVGMGNRVAIIKSETGSGKSTLFPPELYKAFIRKDPAKRNIICTQPRILTAIENVHEMIKNNADILQLGVNIGWSTKNSKISTTQPGIISATVGTLAQELRVKTADEICRKYMMILIDETHERDIDTDITIAALKAFLLRESARPDCPFVALMSATFDETPLLRYFQLPYDLPDRRNPPNFLWCRGEPAGWDTYYLSRPSPDYIVGVMKIISDILVSGAADSPAAGDILVFLPGQAEIKMVHKLLDEILVKRVEADEPAFALLILNGINVRIKSSDYIRTTAPLTNQTLTIAGRIVRPQRRIILSTNVAETGLTLPNMKYVIDIGLNRETEFVAPLNVGGLITRPAPYSRTLQRRGRAGRKFRGVFYPLYTQSTHAATPRFQFPQILTSDVTVALLGIIISQIRDRTRDAIGAGIPTSNQLLFGASGAEMVEMDPALWGVFRIRDMDLVDVPAVDALDIALERLYLIGAISPVENGAKLTEMGIAIDGITSCSTEISPEFARTILAAFFWGVPVSDIVTGVLSTHYTFGENPRSPLDWNQIYRTALPRFDPAIRRPIADEIIDGVALYWAVSAKMNEGGIREWCESVGVNYDTIMEFLVIREEVLSDLVSAGIAVFANIAPISPVARPLVPTLDRTDPDTLPDWVRRYKYCLYDGYRSNLVVREKMGSYYTVIRHTAVAPPELIGTPDAFISIVPTMTRTPKSPVYFVSPGRVSVLDGYIAPDLNFGSAIESGPVGI